MVVVQMVVVQMVVMEVVVVIPKTSQHTTPFLPEKRMKKKMIRSHPPLLVTKMNTTTIPLSTLWKSSILPLLLIYLLIFFFT